MSEGTATSNHNLVVYSSSETDSDISQLFVEIPSTAIPQVTSVRLYAETVKHVHEGHPEVVGTMPGVVQTAAVEKAIVDPTHVEKSYGSSYVFVDATTTNEAGDPLRVPVSTVVGTSARVKSYYFATRTGPAEVLYERPDG